MKSTRVTSSARNKGATPVILVDDRAGSCELVPALRSLKLPITVGRMDFADLSFVGNGPDSTPQFIGVEYKQVGDALNCMTDGRFAGHQLPGLMSSYTHSWLLIEGEWRPSVPDGVLQVRHPKRGFWYDAKQGTRRFMYRELDHWLLTMTLKTGLHVRFSADRYQSACFIRDLYSWWTSKEWAEHRSHLAMNEAQSQFMQFKRPTLLRKVAAQLPGIGWEKSAAIAERYSSILELALADEKQLAELPGIGKKLARRIVEAVQGKED
jgi:ERCC4-type nuclease